MTDLLEIKTAQPHKSAGLGSFLLYVKEADKGSWDAVKALEALGSTKAAISEASGTTGGFLIPTQYSPAIYNIAAPISLVRPRATVVPMTSKQLVLPYLDQTVTPTAGTSALIGNIVLTWGAEGATLVEGEPVFKLMTLTANKLSGYWISSMELDEDSEPTMDVIAPQLFGRAVAWFEDAGGIAGSGVGQPLGVLNAPATIGVTRNAATDFKLVDMYAMLQKAHPNSINSGTLIWVIHPTVIPKLVATHGLQPGAPFTLAGMPIKVSEQCSPLGTAGDVLLCDFAHYVIGDRVTTSVSISPHPRFNMAQDVIKLTHRMDGQPWVSGSMTLKDGTSTVSPFVKLV